MYLSYNNFIKKKKIFNFKDSLGGVLKFLNSNDPYYNRFGEIYFSIIKKNKIKCWKLHTIMTMNLCVPVGTVKFVFKLENKKNFYEVTLGEKNNYILNIKPGIWFGFQGIENKNLVCNLADILHQDSEVKKKNKNEIHYKNWLIK